MASDPDESSSSLSDGEPRVKRVPLGRPGKRFSFERQLRLWLYLPGLLLLGLCWLLMHQHAVETPAQILALIAVAVAWAFGVSLLMEQITRPLQTLSNVVAALREDDYSFRARGGRRNDAVGDLALEVNALAAMLQVERVGAREAMAVG